MEARLRKLEEATATSGRRPYLMQQDAASAEELRAALAREASFIGAKVYILNLMVYVLVISQNTLSG